MIQSMSSAQHIIKVETMMMEEVVEVVEVKQERGTNFSSWFSTIKYIVTLKYMGACMCVCRYVSMCVCVYIYI